MKEIPKAIAYARNVNAIENHSFQAWLQETIQKEDLQWWAQRDERRELRQDTTQYESKNPFISLTGLIP